MKILIGFIRMLPNIAEFTRTQAIRIFEKSNLTNIAETNLCGFLSRFAESNLVLKLASLRN